jgi:hypothetical protein
MIDSFTIEVVSHRLGEEPKRVVATVLASNPEVQKLLQEISGDEVQNIKLLSNGLWGSDQVGVFQQVPAGDVMEAKF